MLEKLYDNRIKLYALFLLIVILVLAVLCTIRATGFEIFEDGSWRFNAPVVGTVTGCWPVMGCLLLDEVIPVDEEWLDSAEYDIGGPLVQDGTLVVSGLDHRVRWFYPGSGRWLKATFWQCYHSLNLCVLRHDDRPLFYRVLPDYPPPGWELIFGPSDC